MASGAASPPASRQSPTDQMVWPPKGHFPVTFGQSWPNWVVADKRLTELAERSAAPGPVAVALERVTEAHPDLPRRLDAEPTLGPALIAVFGASRSLTELCVSEPAAIDVLSRLD